MAWESRCCPQCGNYNPIIPAGVAEDRYKKAPDGRRFTVHMYRCLACGVEELVRREWHEAHKNNQSINGPLAGDGLLFVARPDEEGTNG
jgi:hypothetical protein